MIGFILGGLFGVFIMCLLIGGKNENNRFIKYIEWR